MHHRKYLYGGYISIVEELCVPDLVSHSPHLFRNGSSDVLGAFIWLNVLMPDSIIHNNHPLTPVIQINVQCFFQLKMVQDLELKSPNAC